MPFAAGACPFCHQPLPCPVCGSTDVGLGLRATTLVVTCRDPAHAPAVHVCPRLLGLCDPHPLPYEDTIPAQPISLLAGSEPDWVVQARKSPARPAAAPPPKRRGPLDDFLHP